MYMYMYSIRVSVYVQKTLSHLDLERLLVFAGLTSSIGTMEAAIAIVASLTFLMASSTSLLAS